MANAIGQRLDMTQAAKRAAEKRRQELLARRGAPTGKAENITRGRGKPDGRKTIMPVPPRTTKPPVPKPVVPRPIGTKPGIGLPPRMGPKPTPPKRVIDPGYRVDPLGRRGRLLGGTVPAIPAYQDRKQRKQGGRRMGFGSKKFPGVM